MLSATEIVASTCSTGIPRVAIRQRIGHKFIQPLRLDVIIHRLPLQSANRKHCPIDGHRASAHGPQHMLTSRKILQIHRCRIGRQPDHPPRDAIFQYQFVFFFILGNLRL